MSNKKVLDTALDDIISKNIKKSPINMMLSTETTTDEEKTVTENKKRREAGRKQVDSYNKKNQIKKLYFSRAEIDKIEKHGVTMGELATILRSKLREMGIDIPLI